MGIYKHHEIYTRSMMRCGHGYAPWLPEPPAQLPEAYKTDGVDVCDLLLLTANGGYVYLFNCSLPESDPKNEHGVPAVYAPFALDRGRDCNVFPDRHSRGVPISSSGSRQSEINVSANTEIPYVIERISRESANRLFVQGIRSGGYPQFLDRRRGSIDAAPRCLKHRSS
jgi:hypothetical protein